MARPMILRLLRCDGGVKGLTSKSATSAAIFTGWPEASKERMGPTPLLPFRQAFQNASLPTPLGATTPRPVTTTLRMAMLTSAEMGISMRRLVVTGLVVVALIG